MFECSAFEQPHVEPEQPQTNKDEKVMLELEKGERVQTLLAAIAGLL